MTADIQLWPTVASNTAWSPCRRRWTPSSWSTLHLLGVELLIIDGSTNRRDFADRIRWNQAYYRLAQGCNASVSDTRVLGDRDSDTW